MPPKQKSKMGLHTYHHKKVKNQLKKAPWVLRVTEHNDKPVPVFVVKQRILPGQRSDADNLVAPRSILVERGLLYGPSQLRCLPVVKAVLTRVSDPAGIPLELNQFLNGKRISFRGNLPLDEEAGCKLALLFKLQERVKDLDRIELIARRVDRFTREEAAYWYSRMRSFGDAANRWAMAGMKIMLSGQPGDPNVAIMLEELQQKY